MSGQDSPQPADLMDTVDMKAEIRNSLKKDIATLLGLEMKTVDVEEFEVIRCDLQSVKSEVANSTTTIRSDLETMKTTIAEMERGLSSCSDNVTLLQT